MKQVACSISNTRLSASGEDGFYCCDSLEEKIGQVIWHALEMHGIQLSYDEAHRVVEWLDDQRVAWNDLLQLFEELS